MNATSLYVRTCRVAVCGGAGGGEEVRRLLPYLRAALSCAACGGLLKQPLSAPCPHHVCRACRALRRRLRPACAECRDRRNYLDNRTLRILLQSYKRLCEYFLATDAFRRLDADASKGLADLVREGAGFSDGYESASGLSESACSILPCVYANSSTQTSQRASEPDVPPEPPVQVKQPPDEEDAFPPQETPPPRERPTTNPTNFKKPVYRSRNSGNKRKGCRCGNATATPGKLTCCGQRCPCYVESKACSECKCKGCRNPHRADGLKVRPHIPQLESFQVSVPIKQENSPSGSGSMESLDTDSYEMAPIDQSLSFDSPDIKPANLKVYTSQLQEVSADLPASIMMDEDVSPSSPMTDEDSSSPQLQDNSDMSPPLSSSHHSLMMPVHNIYIPFRRTSPCLSSHQDNTSDIEVEV